MIAIQIFTQNVTQGPGTGDYQTYMVEIIIMLLGSFILGGLLAWALMLKYKKLSAELKTELATEIEVNKGNIERQKRVHSLETKISMLEEKNSALRIQLSSVDISEARIKSLRDQNLLLEKEMLAIKAQKKEEVSKPAEATDTTSNENVTTETKPIAPSYSHIKVENTDLKKIEGVGPRIQEILNEKGINTFSDLASKTVEEIKEILLSEGPQYKVHDPGTWPTQAGLAKDEKWEELAAFQSELKAGKK